MGEGHSCVSPCAFEIRNCGRGLAAMWRGYGSQVGNIENIDQISDNPTRWAVSHAVGVAGASAYCAHRRYGAQDEPTVVEVVLVTSRGLVRGVYTFDRRDPVGSLELLPWRRLEGVTVNLTGETLQEPVMRTSSASIAFGAGTTINLPLFEDRRSITDDEQMVLDACLGADG